MDGGRKGGGRYPFLNGLKYIKIKNEEEGEEEAGRVGGSIGRFPTFFSSSTKKVIIIIIIIINFETDCEKGTGVINYDITFQN